MKCSTTPVFIASTLALLATTAVPSAQDRTIRMPRDPQIAPDATQLTFAWRGDVWLANATGGAARRITFHPANDSDPHFSPDGTELAFVSRRSGRAQIHIVPLDGGEPRQVTEGSLSISLFGYTTQGQLLVGIRTDRGYHYSESTRPFLLDPSGEKPKRMLFDAGIRQITLSPSGEDALFVRGNPMWSRKGYQGPQAAQLWHADLRQTPAKLRRLDTDRPDFQNIAWHNPLFAPDGKAFFYVSDPDGTYDIYASALDANQAAVRLTQVGAADRSDDGVAFASASVDGNTLLFRRRFDLQRLDVASGTVTPIELHATGDLLASDVQRLEADSADDIAFTKDGKQMAFVSGEDVWVMDRVLREPVCVTHTPHKESGLTFSDDGSRLFFVSDVAGEADIWEATHQNEDGYWWLADEFQLRQVTDDQAVESGLQLSPAGDHVAFVKGTDVFVMDKDGTDHRRVVEAWSPPSFDWSPDGRWLVFATQDSDYNSDIWVTPLDGTRKPFNLSQHPDRDGSPVWSGDGKRIAFVSRRDGSESDIYYVNLNPETEESTERDTKLEEAIAAMKKGGGKKNGGKKKGDKNKGTAKNASADNAADTNEETSDDEGEEKDDDEVRVTIDFDEIHDRLHRISIRESFESGLIWSPDGKKLLFRGSIDGERAIYSVEFPRPEKPTKVAKDGLRAAEWLKGSKEIVGLGSGGVPAAMTESGETEQFEFEVRHARDWRQIRRIAFDQGWRAMRDRFYDPAFNNRDWGAIREKYREVASQCLGREEFSDLMNMMLGELNASHMGHRGGRDSLPKVQGANAWSATTFQLGLRFELATEEDTTPGRVVTSVIPGSACDRRRSEVQVGETVTAIEGTKLTASVDIDDLLTMPEARSVALTVLDREGNERTVKVRPTASVTALLYDEWVDNNRAAVEEMSDGKLGYLHIRGMNMSSFRQMETDLYAAGAGKDGLVIDVRFNGGGSTTDHVLTALTQPVHAITKSRGSGEGYPQDRKIYASWSKPIVLMCNEHSFSNAEILSHAVKQLGRGRLVGMRTAGGVISTGGVGLLDGSFVRMPMRGWYLASTGEDMELNGCAPDIALWNRPDGPDDQLRTAVEALEDDVAAEFARGQVQIVPAAARRR